MNKYQVIIEETVNDVFEVEAENEEEAIDYAIVKYKNAEFVLSPGEVTYRQMAILKQNDEISDWVGF